MEQYFEVLGKCPLFLGIEKECFGEILACLGARVVDFHKKETIISEGTPARYIGIVLSGHASIIQTDYFGNRSIVAEIGTAQLFGESFACAGVKAMPVDVAANGDVRIMFFDGNKVTEPCSDFCSFHRQIIYNLMQVMARKNMELHQKLEITSRRSTREKLTAYLLLEAKKHGSNSFLIPYNRQELADYLGVDRSGLSAEIGKLRREGMLESSRNHFTLLHC